MYYYRSYPYMTINSPYPDYTAVQPMLQPVPQQMFTPMQPNMINDMQMNPNMQQYFPPQEFEELKSQYKPHSTISPIIDMTPYKYPDNLQLALQYIKEAVAGESEDRQFYEYLISVAPSEGDKEVIKSIRDDEISHFSLFRQVYYEITDKTLPEPVATKFEKPTSYCEGIKRAIMGEQKAVKKYRQILYAMQDRLLINILIGIITDELRHGTLYNYLYAKNSCKI